MTSFPEQVMLLEELGWKDWKPIRDLDSNWWVNYEQVKEFEKLNGRLPIEGSDDPEEKRLGKWCIRQRSSERGAKCEGRLSVERRKSMDAIPSWDWYKSRKEKWQENYKRLKESVESKGWDIFERSKDSEEEALREWCSKQRKDRSKGKLSVKSQRMLEAIQGWYWDRDLRSEWEAKWQSNFEQVKRFAELNGRLPSRFRNDKEEIRLGLWRSIQRQQKREGKLSEERQSMLESIPGWKWFKGRKELWEDNYNEVKRIVMSEGRFPSQFSGNLEEEMLGLWCATQRFRNRIGKMSIERQKKLEAIPGWWWTGEGRHGSLLVKIEDRVGTSKVA
jgi:hypothetical protein